MDEIDEFDDEGGSLSDRRTLLHSKDLLANIVALVERPNPHLLAVTGAASLGQLFSVRDGMIIGRAIGADIPLREEGISRRHASLRVSDDQSVFISDLESSNGVFVNGTRAKGEMPVREGDFVQLGNTVLMLVFLGNRDAEGEAPLDPITLLHRRAHFLSELEAEFASAVSQRLPLSLTMFAIEGLDAIEQKGGHRTVEDLLSRVARAVRETIQGDDPLIARYSEDEFAILLPDSNPDDAVGLAGWLRTLPKSSEARFPTGDASIKSPFAVCVGQAHWKTTHKRHTDLLNDARKALLNDRLRFLEKA